MASTAPHRSKPVTASDKDESITKHWSPASSSVSSGGTQIFFHARDISPQNSVLSIHYSPLDVLIREYFPFLPAFLHSQRVISKMCSLLFWQSTEFHSWKRQSHLQKLFSLSLHQMFLLLTNLGKFLVFFKISEWIWCFCSFWWNHVHLSCSSPTFRITVTHKHRIRRVGFSSFLAEIKVLRSIEPTTR